MPVGVTGQTTPQREETVASGASINLQEACRQWSHGGKCSITRIPETHKDTANTILCGGKFYLGFFAFLKC